MLPALGHEPIKSALFLDQLSLVLLFISLLGANLWPLWNKHAQNMNTGSAGAARTRGVGSADLAALGGAESAWPTGPAMSWLGRLLESA